MEKKELFELSPLNKRRHDIVEMLKGKVKTGDIFFRLSRNKFMGIPFDKFVAQITKSKFSHAAMAIVEEEEIYLVEVNDRGSIKYRLIDYLDYGAVDYFEIWRLPLTKDQIEVVKTKAKEFLEEDPDYDFNFSDSEKFYCTEATHEIFYRAGIELAPPKLLKSLMPKMIYYPFVFINGIIRKFTGKGFDPNVPCYFVGNTEHGLMSTKDLEKVFEI